MDEASYPLIYVSSCCGPWCSGTLFVLSLLQVQVSTVTLTDGLGGK